MSKHLRPIEVIDLVTGQLNIKPTDLLSTSRQRDFVEARNILFKLLADMGYKKQSIAAWLNRERSTVVYGIQSVEDWLVLDPIFKRKYEKCKAAIYAPVEEEKQ